MLQKVTDFKVNTKNYFSITFYFYLVSFTGTMNNPEDKNSVIITKVVTNYQYLGNG